uniref:Glycosyltransferase n=1 Tax=Bacopa monnieri TaxID=263974 RepID=B9VNU9_BACMN|nr:UDP-glycosyltransferase BMGT1 [Bacopa monnieri]
MESKGTGKEAHILVFPYPAQGHINPVLPFSKFLASKGLKVTIIVTPSVKKLVNFPPNSSISIERISDGSEDVKETEDIEAYFNRFRREASQNLAKFIDEKKGWGAKVIVYDSTMPWVLDIAHERGLLGASFFTQSCFVSAVYCHLHQGTLKYPYEEEEKSTLLSLHPLLPTLQINDLPCFSKFDDPKHLVSKHLTDQFINLDKVDWILFNTFYDLETQVAEWMKAKWPIKTIGPTSLLEKHKKLGNDKNQIISLFEQNHKACIDQWLDSMETCSVVYVSLGSIASIGKEEMEELACGLLMSNCYFLWVVRASEQDKLPSDFMSLASEKGLIVNWCCQTEVLAHPAVACFMTHCGWNSTLEAISCGVPLVTMAQWVDQQPNAKCVEDLWKVGVRIKGPENGTFEREEIARCIQQVIGGDNADELRANAWKWKKLAQDAMEENGNSTKNIEDFVVQFFNMSLLLT